jgi:glycosyltransferase involved in cell wall biosynthesis
MNDLASPTISVCIPVFNCEDYIADAIDSVLSQTYKDIELVILNNASTDNTPAIIKKYSDKRIRLVNNEKNIGAEANWNKALSEAKGKFIKILCADDVIYPTCLEEQLAAFKDDSVVLTCCGRKILNKNGKPTMIMRFSFKEQTIEGVAGIKNSVRRGTNVIGEPMAVMFRRSSVGNERFDVSLPYVIDVSFWFRIMLKGKIHISPNPLAGFRVSDISWSKSIVGKQSNNFNDFIDKIKDDPRYKLSRADVFISKIMSRINELLRILVYIIIK